MKTCKKCGGEMEDTAKFCPYCGEAVTEEPKAETAKEAPKENAFEEKLKELNNTKDESAEYDKNDIENNKILSLFSYLGILILIPLLAVKDSGYAKFHENQGLILLICGIILNAVNGILIAVFNAVGLGIISVILSAVINLAIAVMAILGIVNCVQGKAKELPLIGKFRILK